MGQANCFASHDLYLRLVHRGGLGIRLRPPSTVLLQQGLNTPIV